jgi:UDP-3-O-[3-hydroxymyristoyl] glucosamine N-acyltransferase
MGREDTPIFRIAGIKEAGKGDITFLTDPTLAKYLNNCKATAIIVGKDVKTETFKGANVVTVDSPAIAYVTTVQLFSERKKKEPGVSPLAYVDESAQISDQAVICPFSYIGRGATIGKDAVIYPFVCVGENVVIGEEAVLYPHVTIYDGVKIGNRVIVHSGTVLGSDGFGYIWSDGRHLKIPQIGIVEIEDDVEIGANVTIDRASLGKTVIGKGTKIDNLVQVAHNVTVGEQAIIVAQVGIAGSAKIGKGVVLAGQVGVRDHAVVGDYVKAGGQTGITKDVPSGSLISGTPHMPHKEWMRLQVYLKKLPALFERLKVIEDKIQGEDENA